MLTVYYEHEGRTQTQLIASYRFCSYHIRAEIFIWEPMSCMGFPTPVTKCETLRKEVTG